MSEAIDLSGDERHVLLQALSRPLSDPEPALAGVCLRLCGRGLLQRAGGVAVVNGWHGSAQAFVLTREGWTAINAERHRQPVRRTA